MAFVGGWWVILIMGSIFFFVGFSSVLGLYKHYQINRRLSLEGKECNTGQVHNVRQWVTVTRRSKGGNRTRYHYAANVEYVARSGDQNLLVSTTEYAFARDRFNQLYPVAQASGGLLRNVPLRYLETDLTKFLLEDDLVPFRKSETYCQYLTGYMCCTLSLHILFMLIGLAVIAGGFVVPGSSVGGSIVALLIGVSVGGGLGIFVFPNYCQRQMLPLPKAVQFVSVGLEVQAPPLPTVSVAVQPGVIMQGVPMMVPQGQVQMVQQPQMQMQMQNQQYVQQQQYAQPQPYDQQQQYAQQQYAQPQPYDQQQQYAQQQYAQQQYGQQQQQYGQPQYGQPQTNM